MTANAVSLNSNIGETKEAPALNPNFVREARTKRDKLKKVTQDFEAEFIGMMLKQVRKSMTGEKGLLGGSPESKQYGEMADEAIAQQLSKAGGLGLGKSLYKSLQTVLPPDPDALVREIVLNLR